MHTFVIERTLPGASTLSPAELQGVARKSVDVLKGLGPDVMWAQTFVTGDKLYCVYHAENAELIREHARRGGFPCDTVSQVSTVISPATAGGA